MTGQDVDTIAIGILQDPDNTTWLPADRLTWINAGVRAICTAKPKASTVTEAITVTAGTTRQAVPASSIALLGLNANMGVDGLTPGRAISTVMADRLAATNPNWRRETGTAIKHLVVDDRDTGAYYVWPAIKSGTWYVEALLHKHPVAITAIGQTLPIDDSYLDALVEYELHMAYAQQSENADHAQLSQSHFQKFAAIVGIQVQKQKKASAPANAPENPAYPAVDKNGQ